MARLLGFPVRLRIKTGPVLPRVAAAPVNTTANYSMQLGFF